MNKSKNDFLLVHGVLKTMNYSSKKLISENLENWFVMDHILFGGIPDSYMPKPICEKYLRLKQNYLTTLFEMYKFVDYQSKYIDCPKHRVEIEMNALRSISEARKISARYLLNESKRLAKILKESKNQDIDTNVKRLQLSSLIESSFITNQMIHARKPNNTESPKFLLLRNCLTECKKELIDLSIKYFKSK